jgi:hypothetical protein
MADMMRRKRGRYHVVRKAVQYDAPKPELAEEDRAIGAIELALAKDRVRITPIAEVFAR